MQLQDILFSQGFGTRRLCSGLVQQGLVQVQGPTEPAVYTQVLDSMQDFEPEGLKFSVQQNSQVAHWHYAEKAYIVLHKPAGYECSHKPSAWPSVYSLLPAPLRLRPHKGGLPGVQAVGRLDQDTTGLLILTDDGALVHKLSSPKHHAPKLYEIATEHSVTPAQIEALLSGVVLDDSPKAVKAAVCMQVNDQALHMTLTEGKYHQVKRMIAAVGNRVASLHRSRMGAYTLPADLLPGQWRWLNAQDLDSLNQPLTTLTQTSTAI
jgi:16S rRNA pseudouridine516 synthase